MKFGVLTSLVLSAQCAAMAQSVIDVDLDRYDWFPLTKTKMAIFQECDHQDGRNFKRAFESYPELDFHSFRMLVIQNHRTQTFNSPEQFQMGANGVEVTVDSDMEDLMRYLQKNRIMPVFTVFGTPSIFRDNDDIRTVPQDMSAYAEAFGQYAKLYKDRGITSVWEMWNEPNLGQFLIAENPSEDYMRFYNAMVPAIREADSDACVIGPSPATAITKVPFYELFFKTLKQQPELTPDYFSFHYYGRYNSGPNKRDLPEDTNVTRGYMGDNYNYMPIMITEYEYYQAGDGKDANIERAWRETPVGAASLLTDISYFSEQPDIEYIHWNRLVKNGNQSRHGGVLSYEQQPMAHYYARVAYNLMPLDRVALDMGDSQLQGMASMDDERAAMLFWSDKQMKENLDLNINGLSSKFAGVKKARVTRFVATESHPEGEWCSEMVSISSLDDLEFAAPGFVLVEVGSSYPDYREYAVDQRGMEGVRWHRNYTLCDRHKDGTLTGNYAISNTKDWSVRLGTRKKGSIAAGGFKLSDLVDGIKVESSVVGDSAQPDFAIEIVYELDGIKHPVVLADDRSLERVVDSFEWGFGDAEYVGNLSSDGVINFENYAPQGWASSDRKADIVFVSQGKQEDTQLVVNVSAVND